MKIFPIVIITNADRSSKQFHVDTKKDLIKAIFYFIKLLFVGGMSK